MSNLDVSMRLRLEQDIDKEAKKAEKGLKSLADDAKKLGKIRGIDGLEKDLKKVNRTSDQTKVKLNHVKSAGDKVNRIKTDRSEKELRELGRRADQTRGKLKTMNRVADSGKARALVNPMGSLAASAGRLAGGLAAAFTAESILRGMAEMKNRADELEGSLTKLLLVEGNFTPERRKEMQKRNDRLGIEYGMTQDEILSAAGALAQDGIFGPQQDALLEPILKASKASGSSPEVIAKAVRAVVQNLGVSEADIPKVLDRMLAGGKAGSFEIEDMATAFPELTAVYANSGRKGMDAVDELIAMGQTVRENVGSSGEAATALREILNKIYSPEVMKNMDEAGIDVKKLDAKAKKNDQPLLALLIEEIEKKGMTDQFGLGELVTDTNARLALNALTTKKEKNAALLDEIRNKSDGAVQSDFDIVKQTGEFKNDQRSAALGVSGRGVGESVSGPINAFWNFVTSKVNADFARILRYQDSGSTEANATKEAIDKAKAEQARIEANKSMVPGADMQLGELKQRIKMLEGKLANIQRYGKGGDEKIKPNDIKSDAPMEPYNINLDKGLQESKRKVADAVREMQSMLTFSASPSITPVINAPRGAGATGAAGGSGNSTVHVSGTGSPQAVAKRVTRNQNRAVRRSRNGALSDMGASN